MPTIDKSMINTHNTYPLSESLPIKYIVIHYTAGVSSKPGQARNTLAYFNSISTASADFAVDDANIMQYADYEKGYRSWHAGVKSINLSSIGIEMCSTNKTGKVTVPNDGNWYFTDAVIENSVWLVKELLKKYPNAQIVRHYDCSGKACLPIDKTELLTKHGWIKLEDVSLDDEIAAYDEEKDCIEFQKVEAIVPVHDDEVLMNRDVEATADHIMYLRTKGKFKKKDWGYVLSLKSEYKIKNGAVYHGKGLDITDDELRFLVWVQGDGHYMREPQTRNPKIDRKPYGIEFHLKKKRKIAKIENLLDTLGYRYTICNKSDGSVSYRIWGYAICEWCEQYLKNKEFTYKFLEMNEKQFDIFWEEILDVDGCRSSNCYTSNITNNLDVVQAILATKNKRSKKTTLGNENRKKVAVTVAESNSTVGGREYNGEKRTTPVSCVSVKSGLILIRQNDRTFIVGNCPAIQGWGTDGKDDSKWKAFVARCKETASASTTTATTTTTTTTALYRVRKSWADTKSQIGAYASLENAITHCKIKESLGYKVFDANGTQVYPFVSYIVKVTAEELNIRQGPSTSYKIVGSIKDKGKYTIVEEKDGWGKLKSGVGWISLYYTKKI